MCHVHFRNLGPSIYDVTLRPLRTDADFTGVLARNHMLIGKPVSDPAIRYFEEHGIDRVSAIALFPGCDNYNIVAHDIMHNIFLGEAGHMVEDTSELFAHNQVFTAGNTEHTSWEIG